MVSGGGRLSRRGTQESNIKSCNRGAGCGRRHAGQVKWFAASADESTLFPQTLLEHCKARAAINKNEMKCSSY